MIRPATEDDIPRLLEMGSRFAEKARLMESVGYVPSDMEKTFQNLIANGHPVFIGERGAIGGTRTQHPFNYSHIIGQEVFWWSEGIEGIRLFDVFECDCEQHCHSLRMITLHALNPEKTSRFYTRRGYKPLEHSFIKVF